MHNPFGGHGHAKAAPGHHWGNIESIDSKWERKFWISLRNEMWEMRIIFVNLANIVCTFLVLFRGLTVKLFYIFGHNQSSYDDTP